MAKVSVIIPTYNRGSLISRAVESVLAQTFTDYELIVVDDGSTDQTQQVLAKFKKRIRYIFQENSGVSAARNHGIREATGEYIAFLDSDDYWIPDKLSQQVKVLDNHLNFGIVYTRMPIINENGDVVGMKPSGISGQNFEELLEVWGDIPTSTVMTRKECFEKAGLFDTELNTMEDIDMWLRIARFYDLFEIKGKVLAYYYRHSNQVTMDRIKVYGGLVKVCEKIMRLFPGEANKEIMKKRLSSDQYMLSRAYYDKKFYSQAFKYLNKAIKWDPGLGQFLTQPKASISTKLITYVKPYFYWLFCAIQSGLFKDRNGSN